MNYLQYCQSGTGSEGIQYIPGTQLPSTGSKEKDEQLLRTARLYEKDQPLSGTDPVGQFWVEGAALSKPLQLLGKGLRVVGKPLIQAVDEKLGSMGISYFKNKAIQNALKEEARYFETRASTRAGDAFRLGESSTPELLEDGIQHTQSFRAPTTTINNGQLVPSVRNPHMGTDKIWWTTEAPYQKGADVIILRAELGSGATSDLVGGYARDATWRQTTGNVSTDGMVTSIKDPVTGVYTHTELTPGLYTASKGHSWYTFKNGGPLSYLSYLAKDPRNS